MDGVRVAMWSGPRNLSTALLRSWGNRPDTAVTDEPLYAHYLRATGAAHPGRTRVLAAMEDDWRRVMERLRGPIPGGRPIWYVKHMTHHVTADVPLDAFDGFSHCFLIRSAAEVVASYAQVRARPTLDDLGVAQQWRLFAHVRARTGRTPPVIDATDLRRDPRAVLTALCDALGVGFTERMLSWPPGRRPTDGVWAEHWYGAVERSTGFAPPAEHAAVVPAGLEALHAEAAAVHDRLAAHRLATAEP